VLQCDAVCCSVLQCVAVYCSVLQCVIECHARETPPSDLQGLWRSNSCHTHEKVMSRTHMNESCHTHIHASCPCIYVYTLAVNRRGLVPCLKVAAIVR